MGCIYRATDVAQGCFTCTVFLCGSFVTSGVSRVQIHTVALKEITSTGEELLPSTLANEPIM